MKMQIRNKIRKIELN